MNKNDFDKTSNTNNESKNNNIIKSTNNNSDNLNNNYDTFLPNPFKEGGINTLYFGWNHIRVSLGLPVIRYKN